MIWKIISSLGIKAPQPSSGDGAKGTDTRVRNKGDDPNTAALKPSQPKATAKPENPDGHLCVDIDGRTVPVRIRRHARARRLTLRADHNTGGALVTLPHRVSEEEALKMVRRKSAWLIDQLDSIPDRVPFIDCATVPYFGWDHVVVHREDARGGVWRVDGIIYVSGREEHIARRLTDWLKAEARRELSERAYCLSEKIGKKPSRISVRDTKSRWGSCSTDGALSFSWRLIFAPDWVVDYVVAHEVAHMVEMNHSRAFWAVVDQLGVETERAKAWLRTKGSHLHRYG